MLGSESLRTAGLLAGSVLLGLCPQIAQATETKSFVVSWFVHAASSKDGDCPDGINPLPEDMFRAELAGIGTSPEKIEEILGGLKGGISAPATVSALINRGRIDGKPVNAYTYPMAVPNIGFHEVKSQFAYGFDLDGKIQTKAFEDPDTHEKGVDNEYWRATGCNINHRGSATEVPTEAALHWDNERDKMPAWLITISTEDFSKDGEVTVTFNKALEHVARDANGYVRKDSTFRIDPDRRWQNTLHGTIKNGAIAITQPGEVHLSGDPYGLTELDMSDARLRMKLNTDGSVEGVMGGYIPWKRIFFSYGSSGYSEETMIGTDIPGVYYALRSHADAYPDPKTGENTAISTAWRIVAVPAYAVAVEARSAKAAQNVAALTTPPSITLQEIVAGLPTMALPGVPDGKPTEAPAVTVEAKPRPFPIIGAFGPYRRGGPYGFDAGLTYANAAGRSLYTYAKDTESGRSSCIDDCAKAWQPALVPKGAKASGEWSIVTRVDGSKQWAYKGKPLYAFAKDAAAGEKRGDGADDGAWRLAKFDPTAALNLPYGIGLAESVAANGYTLVDNRGMTIYAADVKSDAKAVPCTSSACPAHWVPVAAALLANARGDFSLITRPDGIKQWAYKGKALYTYSGDMAAGDANGAGIAKNFTTAVLMQNFVPSQASIRQDHARGPIVTTADGMTLYRRDTSYHQPDGHGLPGSTPGNPAVGRLMGTEACDAVCAKTWRPFVAPAGAQPSGFWEIMTRADGTRQWAYKGFALYTYAGDKKAGEKTGNDIYDIMVSDDLKDDVYERGPVNTTDSATLFWSYVEP